MDDELREQGLLIARKKVNQKIEAAVREAYDNGWADGVAAGRGVGEEYSESLVKYMDSLNNEYRTGR